jgi:hypothetical protein
VCYNYVYTYTDGEIAAIIITAVLIIIVLLVILVIILAKLKNDRHRNIIQILKSELR